MEERLKELERQLHSVIERLTRLEQRLDGQASEVTATPAESIRSDLGSGQLWSPAQPGSTEVISKVSCTRIIPG